MNSKPTILVSENRTVFQSSYLEEIWEQYFNVEILDVNKNYDKRSTVVVSIPGDFDLKVDVNERILADKGIRHVIDQCWDSWNCNFCIGMKRAAGADFTLRPMDFIRINESLWYKHLGYAKIELNSNFTRDFLLLMNLEKPHRT